MTIVITTNVESLLMTREKEIGEMPWRLESPAGITPSF
jgi:hypothetical protein